jgi:hypothetical protein
VHFGGKGSLDQDALIQIVGDICKGFRQFSRRDAAPETGQPQRVLGFKSQGPGEKNRLGNPRRRGKPRSSRPPRRSCPAAVLA